MARSPARRPARTPFRHWGLLLVAADVLTASQSAWRAFAIVMGLTLLYVLFLRLTLCRVETRQGQPCRWRVRGLLGTCLYHVGGKWSVPEPVYGAGRLGLPRLMWRRRQYRAQREEQPSSGARGRAATDPGAIRPGYDRAMMVIAVLGVIVALASFARDLVAG